MNYSIVSDEMDCQAEAYDTGIPQKCDAAVWPRPGISSGGDLKN